MAAKKQDFESALFKVLFDTTTVKEDYVASDKIPELYPKLIKLLGDDEEKILKAYSIVYEVSKYMDNAKDRLKDLVVERVSTDEIIEKGYTRGNKKITFKNSSTYDYGSSASIRELEKKVKGIKKAMQEAYAEGKEYIVDTDTGEYIPCASIKNTSRSVVVTSLRSKDID